MSGRDTQSYQDWAQCYKTYVEQQERRRPKRNHWFISKETLNLIIERNDGAGTRTHEEEINLKRKLKRLVERDKRKWKQQKVKPSMGSKEQWAGIKVLRGEYKPKLYAKRDRFGRYTTLDGRAQATAEDLAEEQWKNKANTILWDISETVMNDLRRRENMETKPNIRDEPITEQEFELVIERMARDKSPGPDNITTDWIKDLDQ